MGELSSEERDQLMAAFLPAYNAEHGTNFVFHADGPDGADHDYICTDSSRPKEPLKIQHTRAWADPETEWRHPADVEKFIVRAIQAELDDASVTDRRVHLNVESLPATKKEKNKVFYYLWEAIKYGINRGDPPGTVRRGLEFNHDDISHYFDPIREYVKDLEVTRMVPPDGTPARVFWSSMGGSDGIHDGTFRFKEALGKKEGVYRGTSRDLLLIVDYEIMPYAEQYDIDAIRAWVTEREAAFREIWIVSRWIPPTAHRVWPSG